MDNNTPEQQKEITRRLNEALRYAFRQKGIQLKAEMAKELGYKSPYFSGITTGKEKLTDAFLMNLSKKMGVNTEWILTGQGEMMTTQVAPVVNKTCVVPLVPVSAHGGSLSNISELVRLGDCERITAPMQADLAITVSGESMAPEYPNGSIVYVRKISADAFIEWGKTYVLDTLNGIVIKVLTPSQHENAVRCVSINPDPIYAPFDVNYDDIYGIYMVKGSLARK